MSSRDKNLLKATINRLTARIGEKLFKLANEITVLTKEAPEQLRKEWDLFQKEVFEEADRLNKEAQVTEEEVIFETKYSEKEKSQDTIDRLRAKVAKLSHDFEEVP